MEITFLPLILLGAAVLLLAIFFYYVPFLLWISAKVSGVNISLIQLFLMRIRKVPPYIITRAMIEAHKAGIKTLTRDELEAHYLAGGHVEKVVHALVSASKANIDLPFQMATAIDLAGREVFEAVQMSVNPKVIDTPPVTAVAKDGLQLIAKARPSKKYWTEAQKCDILIQSNRSVSMTVRFHLFPFRTQKLSLLVPKIVSWKRLVKIGSRRLN